MKQVVLLDTREFLRREKIKQESLEAVHLVFFDCVHPTHPLPLEAAAISPPENFEMERQKLQEARARFADNAPEAIAHYSRFSEVEELSGTVFLVNEVTSRQLPFYFKPEDSRKKPADVQALQQQLEAAVSPVDNALYCRVASALSLLHDPALDGQLSERNALLGKAERLVLALQAYRQALPLISEVRHHHLLLVLLQKLVEEGKHDEKVSLCLRSATRQLAKKVQDALSYMRYVDYPLQDASQISTLDAYFMSSPAQEKSHEDTLEKTGMMLDRIAHFFALTNGEIAQIVDQVERSLGLPPISKEVNENR
jgi:hypothetical protein